MKEDNSFGYAHLAIVLGVHGVAETEKGTEGNKTAMAALVEAIQDVRSEGQLVGVCNSLQALANGHGEAKTNGFLPQKSIKVETRDIGILHAGLKQALEQTPEDQQKEIKQSLSRTQTNTISLFMAAREGGGYYYRDTTGKVPEQRSRRFCGLPEDSWPQRDGNNGEQRPDFRINPQTAELMHKALLRQEEAEKTPGTISLMGMIKKGSKSRRGEAKFFEEHLPKGLKPWAEPIN